MGQYHSSKTRGNGQGFRALKKIQQIGAYNHQKKFRDRRKTAGTCRGHEAAGCDCALSDAVICFFMPCGSKAQRIFSLHHGNPGEQKSGAPPHFMALPQEEAQKAGKARCISFRLRGIAFSLLPFPEGRALFAFQGSAALERRKKNAVRWRGGGADCQNPSASSEGSNPLKFSNVPGGVYDAGTTFCSKKSHFQSENWRGRGACIPVHRLSRSLFDKQTRRPMEGRRV